MAYTRLKELDGFDKGTGSEITDTPIHWWSDVLRLINQGDFEGIFEVNVIFQGFNLTALVGKDPKKIKEDPVLNKETMVVLACPPYRVPNIPKTEEDRPLPET